MIPTDTLTTLISGGLAGTAGAVCTCPLEVLKTRLQSSNPGFQTVVSQSYNIAPRSTTELGRPIRYFSAWTLLRHIVQREGIFALYKGLAPNLLGVAPTRAIYFCTYTQSKQCFNGLFPKETYPVYMCSAATAGLLTTTLTNPIWMLKTRLQLNTRADSNISQIIRQIYVNNGFIGFYKGMSASYLGVAETIIHFLVYETVKKKFLAWNQHMYRSNHGVEDNANHCQLGPTQLFISGCFSKGIATCVAYPHEILRTRLREEGHIYKGLIQTMLLVSRDEGIGGLYRGLGIQMIRQIPNMGIMMATFEITSCYLAKCRS